MGVRRGILGRGSGRGECEEAYDDVEGVVLDMSRVDCPDLVKALR